MVQALNVPLDLKAHLSRVSRSFSFCIARLEEPLRYQVGLSYLLCRVLDTVEDGKWKARASQIQAFDLFLSFLQACPDRAAIKSFIALVKRETEGLDAGEELLLQDAVGVLHEVWALPSEPLQDVRATVLAPVMSMAQGMREFSLMRDPCTGALKLQTLADVNRYCFFVAGVVGEILTGLLKFVAKDRGVAVRATLVEGFRFGLFLQKVNLLKDREQDLLQGRDLVPSRLRVFQSLLNDAQKGFSYIVSIPVAFESYRLFCAWSLFLGLASLPHISRGGKIGRIETLTLLASIETKVKSDVELKALFDQYLLSAQGEPSFGLDKLEMDKPATVVDIESYKRIYRGRADDRELLEVAQLN